MIWKDSWEAKGDQAIARVVFQVFRQVVLVEAFGAEQDVAGFGIQEKPPSTTSNRVVRAWVISSRLIFREVMGSSPSFNLSFVNFDQQAV
jgi:hypothetical protein